jgi:V8-like Glu-specific endopeptidase
MGEFGGSRALRLAEATWGSTFCRGLWRLTGAGAVVAASVVATSPVAGAAVTAPSPATRVAVPSPATGVAARPPGPATGTVNVIKGSAQSAARAFWTASRMASATPAPAGGRVKTATPPPGTPQATTFNGVPTVGALFFVNGTGRHYCTASVVDSATENLIITAAHCVYGDRYAANLEFVPGYRNGREPYGAWPVQRVVVASGWRRSHDPDLDFAFLSVAASGGRPIQRVTGGLRLGIDRGYTHPIKVIGYNNSANKPVGCATSSFQFAADQMEFYCGGYRSGTSGAPWVLGYDGSKGTGTVFGVIGGYEAGGDYDWASYSAFFGPSALQLFRQAEASAAAPAG